MAAKYNEIQELLRSRADLNARLNLMPYDGTPEIKERGNEKYLYVRKRVAGKQTSTYVGAYTEELYNLLLRNAREAREIIMENIEYDTLTQDPKMDKERLDEIVDLMLETVCSARKTLRIAGDDYPAELVKSKFLKLNSSHIEFVMDCMRENTTKIRNIKQYLRAVLFNAPSTIDNYYTALVAHDMASPDWGKPKSGIPDYSCSPDESL